MKEIKKSASFKSKQRGKDVQFKIDLNYSPEYDSFIIKVKEGEGFMAYSSNIERMPLEVIQKLNEMLEEVLIKAGSKYEIKEHKMYDGGDFQAGVYAGGGGVNRFSEYSNDALNDMIINLSRYENTDSEIQMVKDELKKRRKYEFGGDFQSGVYARGGSLQAHGIEVGDTFLNTISGNIQKVKDKNGKIVYVDLSNGKRDTQPPLPFNNGGMVSEDLFENYNKQPKKLAEIVDFYMAKYDEGEMDYQDTKNFLKEVEAIGYTFDYGLDNEPYGLRPIGTKLKEYDEGGEVTYFINKDGIKVRSKVEPKRKLTEAEWMAKHNDSKEARTYAFGGLFSKTAIMSRPKPIDLNQQQVRLKSGEYVQVLNQQGDSLMVMELSKLGTGASPKYVRLSDVDMTSFKNGGALIGNQKRIDMNKNGKIDAEDFKLLRSSMNGAWRNERKHVNHNEDYEVRYARKKPARTGYKGKRKFREGGGISNFERLSRVVAKNYEGKRVKPQYQKEYGKVYSKSEAKEVGNKVAGKMKMMKKAESGAEVKKTNRGGVMLLAKKIRKEGESWKDALKRAGQQLK